MLAVPKAFPCNERLKKYSLTWDDICAGKHVEEEVPAVPLRQMKDTPFLFMKPETDTGKRSQAICKRAGFKPDVVLMFQQHSTMFQMACAGMGAAFVTDMMVQNSYLRPELLYYKIGGDECFRNVCFYKKRDKRMNHAMRVFLESAGI